MGDAFLKHYYSAFDFDKNEVLLGINKHSEGKVSMETPKTEDTSSKKEEWVLILYYLSFYFNKTKLI